MLRVLALMLALPAAAQDPARAALEAGGLLWVEPALPKGADRGVIPPALPTLRFARGTVEEGFVFGIAAVLPQGCAAVADCPGRGASERIGAFRSAPYRAGGGEIAAAPARTARLFEPVEAEAVYLAATAFGADRSLAARLDGTVLRTGTGPGARRWLALPEDEALAALALVGSGGFSLRALGPCAIEAQHRRYWTPADRRAPDDTAMLAAARFARAIERAGDDGRARMAAGDEAGMREAAFERMMLTEAIRAFVADRDAPMPAPSAAMRDSLPDGGATLAARIAAEEGFLRLAADGARRVEAAQFDLAAGRAAICG
ncbi:MAG: hypothetical protein ACU0BS_09880 [Hasllibacter sp.]